MVMEVYIVEHLYDTPGLDVQITSLEMTRFEV